MHSQTTRRRFLTGLGACGFGIKSRASAEKPVILLRNSWQTVNIGDIGHTPGALTLIGKHFPEAEVTLWPNKLSGEVREMLMKGYPCLKIADGSLNKQNLPDSPELAKAWEDADVYLSGSGSGFPAAAHAAAFHKATGKPYGVFAVSTDPISGVGGGREPEGGTLKQLRAKALALPPMHLSATLQSIVDGASFFFCRDSISRDYLKAQGSKTPILEFGPDSQLGMHLRDDARGFAYLERNRLQEGKFICVIPRLRYTPSSHSASPSDEEIKKTINDRTCEKDHARLRDLIVAYVKNTGHKVLACPEMTYQIELAKKLLVDPLPAEIRSKVVWRDTFWLPDEAASVYSKARAVISLECHSPLIALRNGTPAFYIREPTDTCKGQMYRDFGADEWLFEVDDTTGEQLWLRLAGIERNPARAKAKVKSIMAFVEKLQKRMVDTVRAVCHA